MDIEFTLPGNQILMLEQASSKRYRGVFLPGSTLNLSSHSDIELTVQEFGAPEYTIRFNILRFLKKIELVIAEKKAGVRFQATLKNDLRYTAAGKKLTLKEGQFNMEPHPHEPVELSPLKNKEFNYFLTSYSPEFISGLGLPAEKFSELNKPRALSPEMSGIIRDILHAPYEQEMLRFFYENKVRELLFLALLQKERVAPGELSARELDAVYAADSILLTNLKEQIPMKELVKKVELNAFKLKKGFRQVFGMGVFERALHYRMESAKKLLIETNMAEKEIAGHAGYGRLTSFIAAFQKRFGMGPREFRKSNR
jgi:AraC family transcriptional regulator, transcriptional activator of the genes for pyochelin and ferripyochelin receptors